MSNTHIADNEHNANTTHNKNRGTIKNKNTARNDKSENTSKQENNFSPALYLLKQEKNKTNINILTEAIIAEIENSNNHKDMSKKLGTHILIKSLERELQRRFTIFQELSRLSLFQLSINPVKQESEIFLSINISFPPTLEKIKTPYNSTVSNVIQGWIIDNNIYTVCPIIIVNTETFFM